MTDTSTSKAATKSPQGLIARFLSDTEIDTRLLGMLGALALIWGGFHLYGVIFNNFRSFFDAAQPLESIGANLFHWDHGNRHGAGDCHA